MKMEQEAVWGEGQEAWGLGLALPDPLNGLGRALISGSPCLQREQSDRPVPPRGLCATREDNERSITLETTKCCRCDEDGDYWSLKVLSPQGPGLSAEEGWGRQWGHIGIPGQGSKKLGVQFWLYYCCCETLGKCFPLRASVYLSVEWVQ